VAWAVEHAENWYGEALAESRQRQRALAISAAYDFAPEGLPRLLGLLEHEDIPLWRATYAGLIARYAPASEAIAALGSLIDDESPMVRERVVAALAMATEASEIAMDALGDSSRSVRIAAARALEGINHPVVGQPVASEWMDYLQFNSDRPQSLFILANRAAREKNLPNLQTYLDRAILLDRKNPNIHHQAAILLSMAGLNKEARARLFTGWELAPDQAVFPYSLGLLEAETGKLQTAIGYLEEAVTLQPDFYRAWYNLSLAYQKANQPEAAARAMRRARGQ
jgi:predicted Zn-dependent protease